MYNPISTYRLQFNKLFTFADAKEQIEYLKLLGVGSIYASPVFMATPGSMHGYDVTSPHEVNSEIAPANKLESLSADLRLSKIGWVQDIVPNHMAFNQHNKWLWDVLEKGKSSNFASFFDIDWEHPDFNGKLMVPFLGAKINEVINNQDLLLDWYQGKLYFNYFDNRYPINFESWLWIINNFIDDVPSKLRRLFDELIDNNAFVNSAVFLNNGAAKVLDELSNIVSADRDSEQFIAFVSEKANNSSVIMHEILHLQHYQLCHWRETEKRINYRRFFTVNDLICLRIEDERVFNIYHEMIVKYLNAGVFDGVRIDHVDGLLHPTEYVNKFRGLVGNDKYIIVEKILEHKEQLPDNWLIEGTSGYDFLAIVNNLFTHKHGVEGIHKFYADFTKESRNVEEIIIESKRFILSERMAGEWDNLARLCCDLFSEPISFEESKELIEAFLIAFPVYRLYAKNIMANDLDEKLLLKIFEKAEINSPQSKNNLAKLRILLFDGFKSNTENSAKIINFFSRCMQLAGPLMAKGVEDTTMYRYNAFVAHNEVGDASDSLGVSVKGFHNKMVARFCDSPKTMNCTSTHDTKRGEDVRARLNILSEIAPQWKSQVKNWSEINKVFKTKINGATVPSKGEEYLIYQMVVGVLPFNQKVDEVFLTRLEDYIVKALREAKLNTNWSNPNEEWENGVVYFVRNIFSSSHNFLDTLLSFQEKVASFGIFNSLSQLALKMTCPGVPDIYRGTELWDLTLVDPDNRRPVDFTMRHIILRSMVDRHLREPEVFLDWLLEERENGNIKLWQTHRLLRFRKDFKDLFYEGCYIPLTVEGLHRDNIMAFARNYGRFWSVTVVPLFFCTMVKGDSSQSPWNFNWGDTNVVLPAEAPDHWHNVFSGSTLMAHSTILVNNVFDNSPVGVLQAEKLDNERSAGVLMHVSSLPGRYACGDFGFEAYRFVDFLKSSGHSCWQVLPFTQVTPGAGWSPYSPPSAFAGNILFISPDMLADSGLVEKQELSKWRGKLTDEVDYDEALRIRTECTQKAWYRFRQKGLEKPMALFRAFCEKEKHWLHDYALFLLFKELFNDAPWNLWPDEVKNRNSEVLDDFANEYKEQLDFEKFRQYLFFQQWKSLKQYANYKNIKIVGDIPIYVSYDNADVWSNHHIFKLDADKELLAVAGVPPDYFSQTGQLWNMPVYNWDAMHKEGYAWWISRVVKNLELYDIVRLDHFRGFESYWEVAAGEPTAVNGRWVKARGRELFEKLKQMFPSMPFIAEDLGEIDDSVYSLRDDFNLPGMQVLQFTFGQDTSRSVHSPHNFRKNSVVYTGTHDNNTIRGWFKKIASDDDKNRLAIYSGIKPKAGNSHEILMRLAWASVANLAIVPMQDLLGLGSAAQMNKPSVAHGNWLWRLKALSFTQSQLEAIKEQLKLWGR